MVYFCCLMANTKGWRAQELPTTHVQRGEISDEFSKDETSGINERTVGKRRTTKEKIQHYEDRAAVIQQRLADAGLSEAQVRTALIYALDDTNAYLRKELSRFRSLLGRPKIEIVESLIKDLDSNQRSIEKLKAPTHYGDKKPGIIQEESITQKATRTPRPLTSRLAIQQKPLTTGGSLGTSVRGRTSSTLAIGQRGFTVRSEQPYEAANYRVKWQKVIDQMTDEEKALAADRYDRIIREGQVASDESKKALRKMFGTEDVATAYSLMAYNVDRLNEQGLQNEESTILLTKLLKRADELLKPRRKSVPPPRIRKPLPPAVAAYEPRPEIAPSNDNARAILDSETGQPLSEIDLPESLGKLPIRPPLEGTKHVGPRSFRIEDERLAVPEDFNQHTDSEIMELSDDDVEEIKELNEPGTWLDIPAMEQERGETYSETRIKPIETSLSVDESDDDVASLESLRASILTPSLDGEYAKVLADANNLRYPPTGNIERVKNKTIEQSRHLTEKDIEDVATTLAEYFERRSSTPQEWIRKELSNIHGQDKQAEVLRYLTRMFGLGDLFKREMVQVQRGKVRDAAKMYENAIERFLPIFEERLNDPEYFANEADIEDFMQTIESFAVKN